MNKTRCHVCVGTGSILGGGMMMKDCYNCDGSGKVFKCDANEFKSKHSGKYKAAKKRIKALGDHLTDQEVENILDKELERQNV